MLFPRCELHRNFQKVKLLLGDEKAISKAKSVYFCTYRSVSEKIKPKGGW